jgi:hypothetical protein
MWRGLNQSRVFWLTIGLAAGLALSGFWPQTPLHAVATDRYDTFAIATGPVNEEVEAIFVLDFLTGDLRAAVMSPQRNQFTCFYEYNILQDLKVDPTKNPKFLMVTGIASLRRGTAAMQLGNSLVYVAETTSGVVAVYGIPWSRQAGYSGQPVKTALVRVAVAPFRKADVVRPQN